MTDERNTRSDEILRELRATSAAERSTRFDELCGEDEALRSRVRESLATEGFFVDSLDDVGTPDVVPGDGPDVTNIGPYEIVRRLGQGGMGLVYEAVQQTPKRRVALKVIRPGAASEIALRRFGIETELLGRLLHPGIARIYEAGTADVRGQVQPYFAMELVEGLRLHEYVDRHDLPPADILDLVARIADAVSHAHQRGVIHRDLKPGNILVEPSGQPKILDFGLARALGPDQDRQSLQTVHGQVVGTLAYMSPEQAAADADEIDTRTDIYSLGALAFELLTGELPFDLDGKPIPIAIDTILHREPRSIAKVDPSLDRDVATIIDKALAREKDRRYATAPGFAADIRRFLNDEPIAARPSTPLYQLGKFARRNRGLVASAVIFVLGLVAAVMIISRHAVRLAEAESAKADALVVAKEALAASEEARDAEAHQRRLAEREAEIQQGVHEYLTSMLGVVDARSGGGRNLTMRDWLDSMATSVAKDVAPDAGVRAHLHYLVGEIYLGLSEYEQSREHLDAALKLQSKMDPPDLELVGFASAKLGSIFRIENDVPAARRMFEQALRCHEQLASLDGTAGVRLELLELKMREGNLDGVEEELAAIIESLERGGTASHTLITAMNVQFNVALTRGDFETALQRAEERIDLLERVAPDDPRLGTALNDAGMALMGLRRLDPAVERLRRSITVYRKSLDENHSAVGSSYFNLGRCLQLLGRLDEAWETTETAVRILTSSLGRQHNRTIQAGVILAEIKTTQKEHEAALEIYEDILERLLAAAPGTLSSKPAHIRIKIGRLEIAVDDSDAALEQGRKALEALTAPEDRLWALDAKVVIARALDRKKETDRSLALFDEVIAAFEEHAGGQVSRDAHNARNEKTVILLELERHAEAVPELEKAITECGTLYGEKSDEIAKLLELLGASLEKLGRTDEARAAARRLEEVRD